MVLLPGLGMLRPARTAAAIVAALVALVASLGVAALSADGAFPTSAIASYALAHYTPGRLGGQCIIFAERVVDAAAAMYGVHPRFPGAAGRDGYYAAFADAGGTLVAEAGPGGYALALAAAQGGDVLQISPLSPLTSSTPWTDPGGGHQHTAILLGREGGGAEVIDSNWDLDLRVRIHRLADVLADAARWGLEMAIWEFGIPDG